MKFANPLIVVSDMEKSKLFYSEVLGLDVDLDFGENVTLTGGIVLQTKDSWPSLIHKSKNEIFFGANNSELYFEENDFDDIRPCPFLFDTASENADTSFEVYFTVPGDKTEKCYNYGFCIGKTGVTEEWLNYKAKSSRKYKLIFYRDEDTLDLAGIPKTSRENIEVALEKQVLVVSL